MPDSIHTDMTGFFDAEISLVPFFNLALLQNALPIARELKLENRTGRDFEQLECRFSSVPDFIRGKTLSVNIKAGEELVINEPNLELNYDFLSNLSESIKGKLELVIASGEEVFFQQEYDCQAFAPDQWLGTQIMPELLASFVTPNLDVIASLQSLTAEELERATGDPSIQGYQADKERVYKICAAIYRAIHSWGIQYANPASSFGVPGQRVRFADNIYLYKLGTCLDTALLFASVMEACGLHPVVMLQKGHAYVGCHLVDRYFPDIPMDNLQTIRKLADMDEFLVLETTMVTGDASFSDAEAEARSRHLNIDDDFECAIDIVRARYSDIQPLPLKRSVNGVEFLPVERNVARQRAEAARRLEKGVDLSQLSNHSAQPDRVVRWTKKLLDLSLRNRLLNVRDTKLTIPVACPNITELEDRIAADESLTLNSLPNLLSEKDLHDLNMLRNTDVKTETKELLDKELSQQRLWTPLPPNEMNRRLTALYRQGKTDLEEGGVNTLFLAIGFVEWKVTERDAKSYLAPILLLPIRLQRKSIVEGIRISRLDGETVINETLLERLNSQYHLTIPGLSPLPTDDSGVDVGLVMRIFRAAIKDMKGWEVREEVRIGHFSFGKFVMWTDMTARLEILKKTPLIDHLISGSGLFDDGIEVFPQEDINAHLDLSKLFCPVSADSSQLAAVLYSEMGKSFVLHGPPGTGKSQTITNIIAHNLAIGKRVLFVSEKKAALDVVHKRLSQIGLKPFCLELHSNKSGKADVLAQFDEVLRLAEGSSPADWENTVKNLDSLRGELDDYVEELHRQYPNGFSAYDCFSHLLSRGQTGNNPAIQLDADLLTQSGDEYGGRRQKLADLAECKKDVSREGLAALSALDPLPWSPMLENDLLAAAKKLQNAVKDLKQKFYEAAAAVALQDQHKMSTVDKTASLLETLKNCKDTPSSFFTDDDVPDNGENAVPPAGSSCLKKLDFISAFADNEQKLMQLEAALRHYRLECFADFDFPGIAERIERNEASFFLVRLFKNRALLKELAGLKKNGGVKLSIPELKKLLPDAEAYVTCRTAHDNGKVRAASLLAEQWNDGAVDWEELKQKIDNARKLFVQIGEITDDDGLKREILAKLRELMPRASGECGRESLLRGNIDLLLGSYDIFKKKLAEFKQYSDVADDDLNTLEEIIDNVILHIQEFRNVSRYRNLRQDVIDMGLEPLIAQLESESPESEFLEFYDLVYFQTMLNQILSRSPLLCQFSGTLQNEKIRKFCEFDDRYMALTRKMIFAKLAARLPRRRTGPCPEGTELGILKRECEKRARQKPVRLLLEQVQSLAQRLKPCFLMSPLSVAQYLPADSDPFDLIVFDEASQIPVWDAIGVIARGRQLIVVGDPKQMPPTNFFQKGESDDEDAPPEETEDLESILDECIVAGVHSTYLNWHYRSRHESLIAFSNHHYYHDRLFTFPAACNTEKLGIRFEFVPDGVYDRKASRTNRKEAEALVKYIFDHLKSADGRCRSIGIVAFSQAQKDLIEDLLEKKRSEHPELECCFDDSREEPLFVKNLENVQGDERDVILFSIGYAPDAGGKFSMNFGPLNRQGGERRLNVAITRAKEQIVVFSSIHADQIDLARTNATGAAHLKYFLDYAEKKISFYSPGSAETVPNGCRDAIAKFLTDKGYSVERDVGCSGFRIDLAVRNPDRPTDFLLGIECDNASHAAQGTARDRDDLKRQVLAGLGWHIYRAWCVDWLFDRKRAEKDLLDFIDGVDVAEPPPPTPPQNEPQDDGSTVPAEKITPAATGPLPSENRREYRCWQELSPMDPTDFHIPAGKRKVKRQMAEIVHTEAPIYESLLKRRIVRAWGINRIGDNVKKVLDDCLPLDLEVTKFGEERVFWAPDQNAAAYREYRVGGDAETRRTIDEIPPEELANAMHEILVDFDSCEKDTLFRETVRLFGFSAVTARARRYLEYALKALRASGRV